MLSREHRVAIHRESLAKLLVRYPGDRANLEAFYGQWIDAVQAGRDPFCKDDRAPGVPRAWTPPLFKNAPKVSDEESAYQREREPAGEWGLI